MEEYRPSAYSTDTALCQRWEPRQSPLLAAQQHCPPTILNLGPVDSQPYLQDLYEATLASLHCVLLYTTKPLIGCVLPSPLPPQMANAIIYEPCCYLSFGAQLYGSKQRTWLQPCTNHRLCWVSSAATELTVLNLRIVQKGCVYTGLIAQRSSLASILKLG